MKWQKKLLVLVACLCSFCACGLFGTNNANAEEVYNPYGVMAFRSYWSSNSGVVNDDAWNSVIGSYPKNILQNVSGQNRRLYGFTIDWNLNDLTSNATKVVTANITLLQNATTGNSFQNTGGRIQISTSNGLKEGSCQFINPSNNDTPHRATWSCTVTADNFANINNGQVVIGKVLTATEQDTPIAGLCGMAIAPECNANVDLVEFSYNITYSNDPNTAILDEQLEIQRQQAEQDAQDRDNIEQTSEDAEQAGEDASENASATGQTLMQAFTSLVTALTGIHQTNCDLPDFNLYGLNFTNMNMCMFNVPNGLMSLASIGMVFIIVPLGINLVKRMIALYNEIVGGGK